MNPGAHSHVYDPAVLLQTKSGRHATDDWHSSTSAKITNKGRKETCLTFFVNEGSSVGRYLKLFPKKRFAYMLYTLHSSPVHSGSISGLPGSAINPRLHSHLYDPTVFLQRRPGRHASDDRHSLTSTKIK